VPIPRCRDLLLPLSQAVASRHPFVSAPPETPVRAPKLLNREAPVTWLACRTCPMKSLGCGRRTHTCDGDSLVWPVLLGRLGRQTRRSGQRGLAENGRRREAPDEDERLLKVGECVSLSCLGLQAAGVCRFAQRTYYLDACIRRLVQNATVW